MAEIRESREPAVHSPPSASRQTIPASLLQKNPHHHHHVGMPHSPTSPTRKGYSSAMPFGRPRSHSLGTAYPPLMMPQTPPPSFRGGRAMSLSPNLYRDSSSGGGGGGNNTLLKGPMLNRLEQPPPPRHNDVQKVMELAMQKERQRSKEMEEQEKDMTADELRAVLKRERHRMAKISGELAKLKSMAVQNQADAEICEEGRINCLMRRLDDLQIEKGRIIVQLEQEEEMLTNTLQKKLDQVRREKAQLEKLIEHEKLSHSDLQSTLTDLQQENSKVTTQDETPPAVVATTTTAKPASALPHMDSLAESPDEEEEEEEGDVNVAATEEDAMET